MAAKVNVELQPESNVWNHFVEWDSDSLRRQESILITLNLCALALLAVLHAAFTPVLGVFPLVAIVLFAARFVTQVIELSILRGPNAPKASSSPFSYYNLTVWINLGFAFVASIFSGIEDAHYTALLAIPVIAAAFRFSFVGLTSVVFASTILMTLEVYIYYLLHPPARVVHFFEVATIEAALFVVGFVIWFLANQIRRRDGELASMLTDLTDTQEKLREEEQLAAIGRLSNAITHEIRNPVSMIASSLAMAARPDSSPDVKEKMSAIAARESSRLATLTAEFLGYANAKAPDKKEVFVSRTLRFVADMAQAQAAERNIRISVDCDSGSSAFIDEGQIHQALLNLVTNAIDFTPDGEKILLGQEQNSDDRLRLYVENAGAQVPDAIATQIFEPFFTTKETGTGMGLAITKNIVKNHGGCISLSINEPGRVRFLLDLPRKSQTNASRTGVN